MGHYQAYQHIHMGVPDGEERERERGRKTTYEDIVVKKFPKFKKYIKIYIQEHQQIPSRINSEIYTKIYYTQTVKSQRQ